MSDPPLVSMGVMNALVLIFGTTMLVQAMVVPSGSMEANLLIGDHVLVDKLAYGPSGGWERHLLPHREVERGDIVVFRYPLKLDEYYVKRVIGIPGDRIRIEGKRVIRNGVALEERYKRHVDPQVFPYRDWFPQAAPPPGLPEQSRQMLGHVRGGDLVIPPGYYFALGDNRDDSLDSRYWGFVPRENIVGRPLLVWWSYESTYDLRGWNLPHLVDLAANFFTRTRWGRTMHLVR